MSELIERHRRVIRHRGYADDGRELFAGTAACSSVAFSDPDSSRWTWNDIAETLRSAAQP